MTATTSENTDTSLHGPNLILDVENFGPIAEAKNIEFKPMTVFVGPSNTGKTYLAMLLHATLRARSFPGGEIPIFYDLWDRENDLTDDDRYWGLANELATLMTSSIEDPEVSGSRVSIHIPLSHFDNETREFLTEITRRYLTNFSRVASQTVADYFDAERIFELANAKLGIERPLNLTLRDNADRLHMSLSSNDLRRFTINDSIDLDFPAGIKRESPDDAYVRIMESGIVEFEIEFLVESALHHLSTSHYFRAGRTGLFDAYRELAANLMQRAADRSRRRRPDRQQAVSLSTSEFLQNLVVLRSNSSPRFQSTRIANIARTLEDEVLGGTINIKETAGITHFEFETDGVTIPLERASSMVTELAPIVMFIRQFIKQGDLLIIDEPEAHLHPEAQQQMAAALAFMVRSGLRVLITTHSHYMVEQLSAFVNASKLDEKTRKRALALGGALGKEDIYLNEDETAVYSFAFSEEHSGSVVKEIFMGEEYEYGPDDHSDATVDQFNRLQRVLEARETAESNGVD